MNPNTCSSTGSEKLARFFNKKVTTLPAGSPCNDFKGYCDVFMKCRLVDADGPLARLKKAIFNPELYENIAEWIVVRVSQHHLTCVCVCVCVSVNFNVELFVLSGDCPLIVCLWISGQARCGEEDRIRRTSRQLTLSGGDDPVGSHTHTRTHSMHPCTDIHRR